MDISGWIVIIETIEVLLYEKENGEGIITREKPRLEWLLYLESSAKFL